MRSCRAPFLGLPVGLLALCVAGAAAAPPVRADGAPAEGGATGASAPQSACVRNAVAAIQRRYEQVRDLRARFVQTTRSVAFSKPGEEQAARGTVQFAKPGKMRWSYEEPEPSLVVSDGSTLWLYDPAHREVQRLSVREGYFSGAAIQFLLGEGEILRDFEVTAHACAPESADLELVPRRPESYERLRVRADPRTGELVRTEVVDLLGNRTIVEFHDIRANLDPPSETFAFEPPDGVRVIDLEAATPAAP